MANAEMKILIILARFGVIFSFNESKPTPPKATNIIPRGYPNISAKIPPTINKPFNMRLNDFFTLRLLNK